ncbi:hypothetical protein Esi_0097_0074 [Ectocarpus siliculosus]|uniref:Transmembrane protein n=1 Tax=Ectocarpus siliculosus TaxID=2880 RepID=D7G9C5_ECTSI|nr:hypothetical protein Esi_0097_0074 [Ectocarpus siliculosus]|eukprot:CBJ28268.1 hypothetical protein Esi_0097_0074 [Ectocarpus siliculosus]
MVSRSSFDLTFPTEVGEGSAFYTMGGAVEIEKSWFRTMASHPRKNTPHETADRRSTAAVGLTVSVSRGCSVDSDAALTGRGVGVTGQRDGAVVFEERKGIRGEFLLVKTDCSFLGRDPNVDDDNASVLRSSSGVGMSSADLRPQGHRQLTMCTPCGCTNLFWLLVTVSMGLITLMGLFCLSRWHPDGRRRWALRWRSGAADRRVHQDCHADGMASARATGVASGDLKAGGVTGNSLTQPNHLYEDLYSIRYPSYEDERSFVLPQNLKKILAQPKANARSTVEGPGRIVTDADADTDTDANDNDSKLAETMIASSSGSEETPVAEDGPGLPPFAVDRHDVSDVRVPRQEAVRDDMFDSGMECFSDDSLVEEETVTVPIGKKVTSARIYRSGSRELPTSPLQVQPTLSTISGSTSRGDGATVPADRGCQPETLLCDGERQVQVAAGNTASGVAADGRDARSLSPRTASSRSPSRGGACPVDHGVGESASSTRWADQMLKEPDDDMCYSPDNEIEGEFFAVMGHQTSGLALARGATVSPPPVRLFSRRLRKSTRQ